MSTIKKETDSVAIIKGSNLGPCVAIVGCTHGNERVGIKILDWLHQFLTPEVIHGEIRLILGNPEAYSENVRYIDVDLNRIMSKDNIDIFKLKPVSERNCEEKRAVILSEYFRNIDVLLDIHATVKPTKFSFVYTANTEQHKRYAKLFNVPYIVCEKNNSIMSCPEGAMDVYIDSNGGIGLTLEAGWIGDSDKADFVKNDVCRLLHATGVCPDIPFENQSNGSEQLIIYKEIIAQTDQFEFVKDFQNFDFLSAHSQLALDGKKQILVDRDTYIIFPKTDLQLGKIAGYLAERKKA